MIDESLSQLVKEIKISQTNLSNDEQLKLVKRIKKNDIRANSLLINSCLSFLYSVANKFKSESHTVNELINVGSLGLIRAAKNFDFKSNIKFLSYAIWWIRQSILLHIQQSNIVRKPTYKRKNQLENDNNLEILSISKKIGNDDENTIEDIIPYNDDFNDKITNKEECEKILNKLSKKEKNMLSLYFGLNDDFELTLEQIGKKYNICRERVRQIIANAFKKLKKSKKHKKK